MIPRSSLKAKQKADKMNVKTKVELGDNKANIRASDNTQRFVQAAAGGGPWVFVCWGTLVRKWLELIAIADLRR